MKTPPPPTAVCGDCGAAEGRLLHQIRHRSSFRRLCSSCVLRLYPQLYCPTCFSVFDRPPSPSSSFVPCHKCYSSSHSHCVPSPDTPYICPPCRNPNSPIFSPSKKVSDNATSGGSSYREIDKVSAKVLLAAAKIAAVSLGKAAVAARDEAEKRAWEAANARKRARAALEKVALVVARERYAKRKVSEAAAADGVAANEVLARLDAVGLRENRERVNGSLQQQHLQQSNNKVNGVGEENLGPRQ